MRRPLISVIVPIYNIEAYVAEALESVISQDIGFEDNVEIILVDDGSTDRSADVCKEYAERFPSNIRYIHQKNGGVSRARNTGLKEAKGLYIHFFDGDDGMSRDFYRLAVAFLQNHESEIDFVAAKLKFFDAAIDSHPLNYKFRADRVADLDSEPDNPILHVITCIFRADSLNGVMFDERLSISEDAKFLSDIILKKRKYGLIKTPTYYYRKRSVGDSAIGGKERNRGYYLATPEYAYEYMLHTWKETVDSRPIEYTLLYDISYRLDQKHETVLSKQERIAYIDSIKRTLKSMHDDVVISHRFLSVQKKVYILKLIYGKDFATHLESKGSVLTFKGQALYDYREACAHIDFFQESVEGHYKIEGYIDGLVGAAEDYKLLVAGREYAIEMVPRVQREEAFLGDVYDRGGAFEATVPMVPGDTLRIGVYLGDWSSEMRLQTGMFTRLATYAFAYRCDDDRIIQKSPRSLGVNQKTSWRRALLELRQLAMILADWQFGEAAVRFGKMTTRNFKQLSSKAKMFELLKPGLFVAEAVAMIPRGIGLRLAYHVYGSLKRRPIWIVSDRGMAAGDNGEAFFRYVMACEDHPADIYFAVSKRSTDYARMKAIGPVLNYGSLAYKLKFLLADKIISSHADVEVTNPFLRQANHFVDLFDFDFVFLQHGVIRNDLSGWLNRFEKNIAVFVTSAKKEYDSILSYPYYYAKQNVLLSGMPRYDYLTMTNDTKEKKIIIAPTYRKSLLRLKTDKYGVRQYDDQFKSSEYYRFYQRLLSDKKLLAVMRDYGVTGEFYVHPNFAAQTSDFIGSDGFTIQSYPYDYRKAISEGSLLVSDFSSIVLDFAYLKKPVIYTHFDVDTFFEGHSYEKGDFFSDAEDGFGPVTHSYDALVKEIVGRIEAGFVMEKLYQRRVGQFFAYDDKNNSKRVYEALSK